MLLVVDSKRWGFYYLSFCMEQLDSYWKDFSLNLIREHFLNLSKKFKFYTNVTIIIVILPADLGIFMIYLAEFFLE
jgi:hypothetical protein